MKIKHHNLTQKIVDHSIIQLSNNFIPKGIVPFQNLFDHNGVPKNPLSNSLEENFEIYNIGNSEEIINVKIFCSPPLETTKIFFPGLIMS